MCPRGKRLGTGGRGTTADELATIGGVWLWRRRAGTRRGRIGMMWPRLWPYSDRRLESLPPRERRRIIQRINGKAFRHWQVWLSYIASFVAMLGVNHLIIRCHYPLWVESPAVGLAGGGFLWIAWRVQASRAACYLWAELDSACLSCGYDLTGNSSGVCPECGVPVEGAEKRRAATAR
jgi:hypothetical protein